MIQLLIPLETKPNLYGKQHWNNNHLFGSHPQLVPRIWQRLFTSKVSHPKQLPIQWADAAEEGGKPCQSTEKGCKEETSGDQKCRSLFTAAEEEDHRLSPPPGSHICRLGQCLNRTSIIYTSGVSKGYFICNRSATPNWIGVKWCQV